jgi:cobalt/nickel transport system permease protein
MHLGNGAVTPECAALGFAVATAGLGASAWSLAKAKERPALGKALALGGLVFAAQMLNVPVLADCSAHLVGGVLVAALLGPASAALTMATVLFLQAVLLGDGGLAALGVNIVNMALVPAGLWLALRSTRLPQPALLAAAASVAIVAAVLLISGEVALGRRGSELATWPQFVQALAINHLPVLALEGVLTIALVAAWRRLERTSTRPVWQMPLAATGVAFAVLAVALAASSSLDDGYESAARSSGWERLLAD